MKQDNKTASNLTKHFTDKQIGKLKECHSFKECADVLKEEGYELPDEALDAVSGGSYYFEDNSNPDLRVLHIFDKDNYEVCTFKGSEAYYDGLCYLLNDQLMGGSLDDTKLTREQYLNIIHSR